MTLPQSSARPRNCRGLTLVELLISLLLGLFLTAGIVTVYLESKRNFAADEELARIQENGRFALALLKRELMLAGFYGGYLDFSDLTVTPSLSGCASGWALEIGTPLDFVDNYDSSLAGVSGDTLPCLDTNELVKGTDIVAIKRSAGEPTVYEGNWVGATTAKDNQIYLQVEDYGDDKNWVRHTSGGFSPAPDPNDVVEYWETYAKIFFIRDHSVDPNDAIPTLCVQELVDNAMVERCLVEGVENMQLSFGVDTQAPEDIPDMYVADPNSLDNILTARLYLLMRSVAEMPGDVARSEKSFTLGLDPNAVETNDGYLRRIFSTTVQVRNAALPSD